MNEEMADEGSTWAVWDVVYITVVVIILGCGLIVGGIQVMSATEEPVEETEFGADYGEQSVDLTIETGDDSLEMRQVSLYIDGNTVPLEYVQNNCNPLTCPGQHIRIGDTLNYVHGNEWDGEKVRLVSEQSLGSEVIYEGTAPSQ